MKSTLPATPFIPFRFAQLPPTPNHGEAKRPYCRIKLAAAYDKIKNKLPALDLCLPTTQDVWIGLAASLQDSVSFCETTHAHQAIAFLAGLNRQPFETILRLDVESSHIKTEQSYEAFIDTYRRNPKQIYDKKNQAKTHASAKILYSGIKLNSLFEKPARVLSKLWLLAEPDAHNAANDDIAALITRHLQTYYNMAKQAKLPANQLIINFPALDIPSGLALKAWFEGTCQYLASQEPAEVSAVAPNAIAEFLLRYEYRLLMNSLKHRNFSALPRFIELLERYPAESENLAAAAWQLNIHPAELITELQATHRPHRGTRRNFIYVEDSVQTVANCTPDLEEKLEAMLRTIRASADKIEGLIAGYFGPVEWENIQKLALRELTVLKVTCDTIEDRTS